MGSFRNLTSDSWIEVVVRLNFGSRGEDVFGSEVWGSERMGMEMVGSEGEMIRGG